MKKIVKYAFLVFICLFFLTIGFYLWASSPNLSPNDYSSLETNSVELPPKTDRTYSIMTYNIGYLSGMTNNLPVEKPRSLFEENLELVMDGLKQLDPDIIALQEIDYDSKRSYNLDQHQTLQNLGYPYSGKSVNWDKRYVPFPYFPVSMHFGKIISGQSVLSKYPIVDQERIELQRNPSNPFYYDSFYLDRLAQIARLEIDGRELVIIHVHLEAFDQPTRLHQIEKLRSIYGRYCKLGPTIMLGDFNSDVRYDDAGIILLNDMAKTGNAAFEPSDFESTYPSDHPTDRLDYIYYSTDHIQELDARVVAEFGQASDHLPVILNFKFANPSYGTTQRQPNP